MSMLRVWQEREKKEGKVRVKYGLKNTGLFFLIKNHNQKKLSNETSKYIIENLRVDKKFFFHSTLRVNIKEAH